MKVIKHNKEYIIEYIKLFINEKVQVNVYYLNDLN